MAITRSMTAKLNQDASSRKRPKTVDNHDGDLVSAWSCLIHDILISLILRLGVFDFVAFSCVCKSWRTVALSNRKMFMLSKEPMKLGISSRVAKEKLCYLEDSEGRKFKTILPCSSDSIYLGLVSCYVILLGSKTHDFRLVNPITRRELHFPRFDFHEDPDPQKFRCILTFSSTMSTWVFGFSIRFSNEVSFCFSIERANWTCLSSDIPITDLNFFEGKIYALNVFNNLCEVRLSPTPTLTLLKMKISFEVVIPEFATWGENLYTFGYHPFELNDAIFEIEFDQMRWVNSTMALEERLCFLQLLMSGFPKPEFWTGSCGQYTKFVHDKQKIILVRSTAQMWYFPHKCLDVNLLIE